MEENIKNNQPTQEERQKEKVENDFALMQVMRENFTLRQVKKNNESTITYQKEMLEGYQMLLRELKRLILELQNEIAELKKSQ